MTTAVNQINKNDLYEIPPMSPDGNFDVRFHRIVCRIIRPNNQITSFQSNSRCRMGFPFVLLGMPSIRIFYMLNRNRRQRNFFGSGRSKWEFQIRSDILFLKLSSDPAILPKVFSLQQNSPNPFNPSTTIRYNLPVIAGDLTIYNTLGEIVVNAHRRNSGCRLPNIDWNAGNFASGVYFYRLRAMNNSHDVFSQVRKMVLMR